MHAAAQEIGRLGPTMYFGELALLHHAPRAATVLAHTDCDLLELGRADFAELMGSLAKTLEAHAQRYGLNASAKAVRALLRMHAPGAFTSTACRAAAACSA
jgi:CRP-like cAMP-binding protein